MDELASEAAVAKFLAKEVHKDLQVKQVQFIKTLSTTNMSERTAYIKVTLASKRQAQMCKSALKQTWLHDSLLKVKTQQDANKTSTRLHKMRVCGTST